MSRNPIMPDEPDRTSKCESDTHAATDLASPTCVIASDDAEENRTSHILAPPIGSAADLAVSTTQLHNNENEQNDISLHQEEGAHSQHNPILHCKLIASGEFSNKELQDDDEEEKAQRNDKEKIHFIGEIVCDSESFQSAPDWNNSVFLRAPTPIPQQDEEKNDSIYSTPKVTAITIDTKPPVFHACDSVTDDCDASTLPTMSTIHAGTVQVSMSDFFRQKHFEDLGHEPGYYQITGEKAPEEKSILLRFGGPNPVAADLPSIIVESGYDEDNTKVASSSVTWSRKSWFLAPWFHSNEQLPENESRVSDDPEGYYVKRIHRREAQKTRVCERWLLLILVIFVTSLIVLLTVVLIGKNSGPGNNSVTGVVDNGDVDKTPATESGLSVIDLQPFYVDMISSAPSNQLERIDLLPIITANHLTTIISPQIENFASIDLNIISGGQRPDRHLHQRHSIIDSHRQMNVMNSRLVSIELGGSLFLQRGAIEPQESKIGLLLKVAFSGIRMNVYLSTLRSFGLEVSSVSVTDANGNIFGYSTRPNKTPTPTYYALKQITSPTQNPFSDINPAQTPQPTSSSTRKPTRSPTRQPTAEPTTRKPTRPPTMKPTITQTREPTKIPPFKLPSREPTRAPTSPGNIEWKQIGSEIRGYSSRERLGNPVSLSRNGKRMAIGGKYHSGGGKIERGIVRLYEESNGNWKLLRNIYGKESGNWMGYSVAMSGSGTCVAAGAIGHNSETGLVRIYEEHANGSWNRLGNDILGSSIVDSFGSWVSLSYDGDTLAIGAFQKSNRGNNDHRGYVRVFTLVNGHWQKHGDDIIGEADGDYSGRSVSLSSDGQFLAIGSHGNDGMGEDSGQARIFRFSDGKWIQMGKSLFGAKAGDTYGRSLALSDNGYIIAVGADKSNANCGLSGQVQVLMFDQTRSGGNWVQMGNLISGENAGDEVGWHLALSSDGKTLGVAAWGGSLNGKWSGYVTIYRFNGSFWIKVGNNIIGENQGDEFGRSISLSGDGSRVAVGATWVDRGRGSVTVYEIGTQ